MAKHLVFDLMYGILPGQVRPGGHPQDVLKQLGITYQWAVPQTLNDSWWLFNCENIPDPLPPYLEELYIDPMEYVGYGLTKKRAEAIRDYKTNSV